MGLENTLLVLNAMQADRVIGDYAIGGAVAAFLYIEPGTTFDLDIFMAWEPESSRLLDIGPIYEYLRARGHEPRGETVSIGDWEVQFLPLTTPLIEEALQRSNPIQIGGVATRIFTQEHLMAICLETGRPKDFARLVQFAQEGESDERMFVEILDRHGLIAKWTLFQERFFRAL